MAAPDTSGLRCMTHARLVAWRVAKLSEQSSTIVACCYQLVKRRGIDAPRNGRDLNLRIDRLQRALARSAPWSTPTRSVVCRICRCRLVRSTASPSTRTIDCNSGRCEVIGGGRPESPGADHAACGLPESSADLRCRSRSAEYGASSAAADCRSIAASRHKQKRAALRPVNFCACCL